MRKCLLCGCTEDRACDEGCAWVDNGVDICTACVDKIEAREMVADQAREIMLRRNVYKKQVQDGKMTLKKAAKQIAISYAILDRLKAAQIAAENDRQNRRSPRSS